MHIPTVCHFADRWLVRTSISFFFPLLPVYRFRDMEEGSPLVFSDEKQPDWVLSALASVGSARISDFKGEIALPSQLRFSPRALETAERQLQLLGGDRCVFRFSTDDQGMRLF